MATETDICNLALLRLGAARITSIDDLSPSAQYCKVLYPQIRDSVLRDHDWNFARLRKTLALLPDSEVQPGFTYAYGYPSDCLRIIELYNPSKVGSAVSGAVVNGLWLEPIGATTTDRIIYEVASGVTKTRKVILTNQQDAVLIYIARIDDPTMYDNIFRDALAWRLAAELASPLKGDAAKSADYMQKYMLAKNIADVTNNSEGHDIENTTSSYEASRR